jgi:hypothetical protein
MKRSVRKVSEGVNIEDRHREGKCDLLGFFAHWSWVSCAHPETYWKIVQVINVSEIVEDANCSCLSSIDVKH